MLYSTALHTDRRVQVLSRELLYTAVTRAKKQLILSSDQEIYLKGIRQPLIRHSGLIEQLHRCHTEKNAPEVTTAPAVSNDNDFFLEQR